MSDNIPTAQPAESPNAPQTRLAPVEHYPAGRASLMGSLVNWMVRTLFFASLLINALFFFAIWMASSSGRLSEKHISGSESAADKIAVVRMDGPILEGFIGYVN